MFKWIEVLFKPVANIFAQREARKAAKEAAVAKLSQAKAQNNYNLDLTDREWEAIAASGLKDTWRDEYATVSILSVFNIIVVGGLASAFGYPQILEGIGTAVMALGETGVDVGFLLETVTLAAVGLSVWRRF